ncbi:MAG: hypothetical protein UFA98_12355 [Ruminococcus sp.]|nr:hypothetical protein [Ruminococcus sp.]
MKKKVLGAIFAGAMAATIAATSIASVAALKTDHSKYTPSAGVETYKYYLAMPGCWINDSTKDNNDAAGCYWWDAADNPGDRFPNGWPGYEMDKEEGFENLYSINAPQVAAAVVFSNYLDGGMDSSKPEFSQALQCKNSKAEYYNEGDSDNYSPKFWKYMWKLAQDKAGIANDDEDFSNTYEAIIDDPDIVDFTPEFGENGKVFFSETEQQFGLSMRFDGMIWIVDLNPDHMTVVNEDLIPGGKPVFDGDWYFMYGNGEYGMWPTKEMALEQEGLTVDEEGKYVLTEDFTEDEYGTIRNKDGYIVVGNFTGRYYEESVAPTIDPSKVTTAPATTVAPATSATSESSLVKAEYQTGWIKGSGKDFEFKLSCTADTYSLKDIFKYISVNDKEIDPSNYTITYNDDGTAVLAVKASFMETLATGKATFKMHFETAEGATCDLEPSITIIPAANGSGSGSSTSDASSDSGSGTSTSGSNPNPAIQTGASSFAVIILFAAVGAVLVTYFRRRKTN